MRDQPAISSAHVNFTSSSYYTRGNFDLEIHRRRSKFIHVLGDTFLNCQFDVGFLFFIFCTISCCTGRNITTSQKLVTAGLTRFPVNLFSLDHANASLKSAASPVFQIRRKKNLLYSSFNSLYNKFCRIDKFHLSRFFCDNFEFSVG